MANETPLNGSMNAVLLAQGYALTAPGITGNARKIENSGQATRGVGSVDHSKLFKALDNEDATLLAQFELEITGDQHKGAAETATRAAGITAKTAQGEPAMVLTTPKRSNSASAVLYTDENGESRWIWPDASIADNQKNYFYLPREGGEPEKTEGSGTRGVITAGLRRVVNVVGWLTDDLIELGVVPFVKKWEEKKRPYGLHAVQPAKFGGDIAWGQMQNGRALMLIHGTFSTGQDAFDGLIKSPWMAKMNDYYQGRIFAFNHPSLHHSPTDNIKTLLEMLPAEAKNLDLDIITHSRGGLVGRELCERFGSFNSTDKRINVHRAVFVAGPNNGTILTDRDNWTKLIDTYTNLLTTLPDTPATITMEALVTLVKVLGGGTVHALPGLQSMLPGGDWIKGLNAAPKPSTTYYALAAQYLPSDDNKAVQFGKRLLMKALRGVFQEDSDLVVPTKGCYETNPRASGFPIAPDQHKVYDPEDEINHLNFFEKDAVNQQLYNWLSAR